MFGSQSPSSSQPSQQPSQGFGASISGTLRYIGETIAQYTGLGSQTPPASQQLAQNVAEDDDEVILLPSPHDEHAQQLRDGEISINPRTGLKTRDYAYKNPLPPVQPCKCCETEALFARMAKASPSNVVVVRPLPVVLPSVATPARANPRPLKRSRITGQGYINGLTDLDFLPPEMFKSSQKSNTSKDSEEERDPKRQKRLQRENTEPFIPDRPQRLTRSPGFNDACNKLRPSGRSPQPQRNKPNRVNGNSHNVFAPVPAAGPSRIDRDALWDNRTPTPPFVPFGTPKLEGVDVPMEDIIATPTLTPQGSEVFSEWGGFSSRSSSVSLAPSSSISRHITPIPDSRPLSGSQSENNFSDTNSSSGLSGATLVQGPSGSGAGRSVPSPYQLRPRPNSSSTSSTPRKLTAPRFTRRRSFSPMLSLALARRHTGTKSNSSKSSAVKTRSTMSKRASEKNMTVMKSSVRQSPRTKARTSRMVLACVLLPASPKRRGSMRSRVRC